MLSENIAKINYEGRVGVEKAVFNLNSKLLSATLTTAAIVGLDIVGNGALGYAGSEVDGIQALQSSAHVE